MRRLTLPGRHLKPGAKEMRYGMTGCRRWVLLLAMMAVAACSSMGENTKRTEAWVESRLLAP
jgi:hypothetical protein